MKKYIVIIVILIILDIILLQYLKISNEHSIPFEFGGENDYFLYQISDMKLNSIDEFQFDKYFKFLSFNEVAYKYELDENNLLIDINNTIYSFKYELIEPKIIEKTVYVNTKVNDVEYKKEENNINNNYIEPNQDSIYVDNYHFVYSLDTDLNIIRNDLINNIHSSSRISIDYSNLNVSYIGQYSVFYITENEKIEIIIEIM